MRAKVHFRHFPISIGNSATGYLSLRTYWVPLGRHEPAEAGLPARVVLHRRPIQTRARGEIELRRIVLDTVVEQVAELLGIEPEEIDSGYSGLD
mgnify:CR=1 FL=1